MPSTDAACEAAADDTLQTTQPAYLAERPQEMPLAKRLQRGLVERTRKATRIGLAQHHDLSRIEGGHHH